VKKIAISVSVSLICLIGGIIIGREWYAYLDYKSAREFQNIVPENKVESCVPDDKTAIKIAEAVWLAKYDDSIIKNKPYDVSLKDGVWTVRSIATKGHTGGGGYIEISREDGRIIRVIDMK
jgi:hypothetical protein